MDERRPTCRNRIQVPIDRIAEHEPAVAQEIETPLAEGVGGGHGLVAGLGHALRQEGRRPVVHDALEEASGANRVEVVEERPGGFPQTLGRSSCRPHPLQPFQGFLPPATGHFAKAHAQQPAHTHAAPRMFTPPRAEGARS